jgi:hypothetical protein
MPHRPDARRAVGWCLVALLSLALATPIVSAVPSPNVWPAVLAADTLDLPVATGIQYHRATLATADGPLVVHQMQVDLGTPTIRLGVGLARDRLMSDDEPVSSMVLRTGAIAGVNADYFDIHQSGIPLNIVVQQGQLLRSPWRWVAFVVGKDGTARIIRYRWTGSITLPETGETRALDGFNTGLIPNGIVLMSNIRGYGAPPPDPATRQMVVELTAPDETGHAFVKQMWPQQAFYAPFPNNDVVLVGLGAGADWLARLTAGSPVQLNLTTDPDWHDALMAIGGGPILVQNGQIVEDPDAPSPKERDYRYPVMAVGIGRDGHTLTFVEVDGRQPALSIGLTRPQLAQYMLRLGAVQAMAFDSGGSATMVVRLPGAPAPAVVNSPSDGQERPVGDAILVYSSAVPGPPARVLVNAGHPLELFAGASATLPLIGVDAQDNPVALSAPVSATVSPPTLVTVAAAATAMSARPPGAGDPAAQAAPPAELAPSLSVTAGPSAGSGTLQVQSGDAGGSIPVSVVTRLSRLVVSPASVAVAPGAGAQFTVSAQDADGRTVGLAGAPVAWSVTPSILGAITPGGAFVAGDAFGAGSVTVRAGGAAGHAQVAIGSTARYLSVFDRGAWSFRGYPATVSGSVGLVRDPEHDGHPSARLAFALDGSGTRAAYLLTQLPLPGAPTGISVWVYGDGSGVWLRGAFDQANGDRGTVTLARRVDWTGWRSITVQLPPGLALPITWATFYVVETDASRTPHGVIYLSDLRAIYPAGAK